MTDTEEVRRYYDAILPYYDESLGERGDLPFWNALATRWGAKQILELGSGTGRVTEVLIRHASVTALDLLVEMLRRTWRRAPGANLVAADLRQFAFAERFDLIVLADDPMAHLISLDDRAGVLRLIAGHLTRDGRVVIEGLYRPPQDTSSHHQHGSLMIEESWKAIGDTSVWNASYRYKKGESTAGVSTIMRSWSRLDLELLTECGLSVEHLWGGFDETPFSVDSKRLIIAAKLRPPSDSTDGITYRTEAAAQELAAILP